LIHFYKSYRQNSFPFVTDLCVSVYEQYVLIWQILVLVALEKLLPLE